jgi:hypothetical protein
LEKIMAKFEIEADSETIKIDGFEIAPAEAAKLTEAVGFAGGVRDFPRLPEKMEFPPFLLSFSEDGTIIVRRANGTGGKIEFSFSTVDELIVAVQQATAVSVDQRRLRPTPRVTSSNLFGNEGDIVEGR